MYDGEVICGNHLPTDQESPVPIVPAVGALNDPSPGLLAADGTRQRGLAAAPDMRRYTARPRFLFRLRIVVPFVQADVLRPPGPARRSNHHGVERLAEHVFVVDVGSRDGDAQGNPVRVCQNVAFCPEFCTIGRTGAREVPPFGAFTLALSSEHQLRSIPTSRS